MQGFNDFATVHQWDREKNGPRYQPEMMAERSRCSVWWRCPQGHSYRAVVFNRVVGRSACPYCSGRKKLPDEEAGV